MLFDLFHLDLYKLASATWKLFLQFLNVLNWMFQCQDVISSKPGFALAEGNWSNLIRIHSLRPFWQKTPS